MSDNVINIPRESTMKALMEMQKMAVAGGARTQCTSQTALHGIGNGCGCRPGRLELHVQYRERRKGKSILQGPGIIWFPVPER